MEPIEAFLIKDPRATTSLDLGLALGALSLGALRLPDPAPSVLSSVGEQRPSFTLIGKSNLVSPPCAHGWLRMASETAGAALAGKRPFARRGTPKAPGWPHLRPLSSAGWPAGDAAGPYLLPSLLQAPVVLSRDHHDVSGTDSPFRETSNIYDGSAFCAGEEMECGLDIETSD